MKGKQSGQAYILMVMVMSLVGTSIALFVLQHSQSTLKTSTEYRRTLDVFYAMNGVARWLEYLYRYECGCDPYVLNNRINELPNRVYTSNFRYQSLDPNSTSFQVSIGELSPSVSEPNQIFVPYGSDITLAPINYYSLATANVAHGPQDVSVTYWVSPFGFTEAGFRGRTRYEQTITLINTCTFTPPVGAPATYTPGPLYGSVDDIPTYAGAVTGAILGVVPAVSTCKGDINNDGVVDFADYLIFQNWLKSGDTLQKVTPLAANCTDLNADGVTNEIDLAILTKALKGYLYYTNPANR